MLTVYKASAGSGKTFQLVVGYLRLLLINPYNYRHILAVTFTNKATNEMKSRILEQLDLLSANKNSAYLELLIRETSFSETLVRKRARMALRNILHDYSRFSVNTIDSFTQRVIKAFNREMGISPHFVLELDNELILKEAVDRLLSKVDEDKQLRKWLVEFSAEKIRENKSQRIEDDISNLGKELFKEKFQVFFSQDKTGENQLYSRENLESFRKELYQIMGWFEHSIKQKAGNILEMIQQNGFSANDFLYKLGGVAGYIQKLAEGEIKEPGKRVVVAEESVDKWFSQTHKQRVQLEVLVESQLLPALQQLLLFFRDNIIVYNSAIESNKQLRMLGILTDLKEEIKALLYEKGILQLSDSNLLLSRIIGDSESPFIYEKIGTRYHFFMLDEFQDTSTLQWKNLKPLLANALSEGHPALLVGDVKQSVYRWRNSDWQILATQIQTDFPNFPPNEIALQKNWRSTQNIIRFNNAIFPAFKQIFEDFMFCDFEHDTYKNKFSGIYKNLNQEPGNSAGEKTGLVEISFLSNENFGDDSLNLLVEQVKKLQDNGLKASETAILIRKNNEGASIIEAFFAASKKPENAGYNLSVLSNESLFLYASRGVNLVVLILELLIDSEDKIPKAALLHLWLSWLKPALKSERIILEGENQLSLDFENPENKISQEWQIDNNFEEIFEMELGDKMKRLKEKILLSSLDETVTEICDLFGLFEITTELPYLQSLIDQAADIKMKLSNDLSNFLFWWKEKGHKSSVTINDEVDSIRLLTVHKSKGLEFEAVLLPFFNWEILTSGTLTPLLWCQPNVAPFSKFPLLPLRAGSKLAGTIFKDDYFEEKSNMFSDTLNLVYVAFTRAKSALFVNCKKPDEKKNPKQPDDPGKSVNSVLHYALEQISANDLFSACWNEDNSVFGFGNFLQYKMKDQQPLVGKVQKYHYYDFKDRIHLRLNSEEFLLKEEHNKSVKNTGKLVHEILAEIKTTEDIEMACNKALKEGKITRSEWKTVSGKLNESLKNPVIRSWFDGSFNVINERNLLSADKILRPDRMMFSGKHAIVVDYKWGDKKPEKYHRQLRKYTDFLKGCGFEKVEGYLWYINQNDVEKV